MSMKLGTLLFGLAIIITGCGGGGSGGETIVVFDQGAAESFRPLEIADMDSDGFPDIVAASISGSVNTGFDGRISIFWQSSTAPGSFNSPEHFPYSASGVTPREITVDDLQMNGLPDIIGVSLTEGGFRVLLNDANSPRTLLSSTHYGPMVDAGPSDWPILRSADLNGDLMPDIVIAGEDAIVYYPQDGSNTGAFLGEILIGIGTENLAVGDLNGDGLNDVVTFMKEENDVPDTVLYYPQNSLAPGQFTGPIAITFGYFGLAIGLADVDGDTRTDIIVSGFSGGGLQTIRGALTIFLQTSGNTFQRADDHTMADDSSAPRNAIADLDADGDLEIVVGQRRSSAQNIVQIYSRGPSGAYASSAILTIPEGQAVGAPGLYSITIADLNDDTQPDIAVSTNEIFVFFQLTGQPGSFGSATRIAAQR